ncbi:MAG: 2-oxoglutarate dehydrogenase complex dihydrolipoyllysine-residue succinyltransferase [Saprospiraceae bacterium]
MSLIDLRVPAIGESISEVTLSKWLKADNSIVNLDEALCEFESDKATLEFPSEASGRLIHKAKEGEDLKIGALVAQIDTSVLNESISLPEIEKKAVKTELPKDPKAESSHYAKGLASPSAAKMMEENNLKTEQIQPSGKDGRITKADVIQGLESKQKAEKISSNILTNPALFSRNTRVVKMSRMRRSIAKHLVVAKNETAMLTTFNEVDMTALMELRSRYNEEYLKRYGVKIGFMSLFAKACSAVLLQMPEVNAQLVGEDLIYHDFTDISIAISTPNGLVVPPIRNVESLKFYEIELQLKNLAEKARNNKLSLDEMSGGTFTITNGGIFGSLMSTPIINEPQSAILGMHSIKDRPIAINNQVVIRPMMYLAMSYDHRVIDGSSSVTFLVKLKDLLEDPVKLFLEI